MLTFYPLDQQTLFTNRLISRTGFTEDAIEYAKRQRLFCSDGQAIHSLQLDLK